MYTHLKAWAFTLVLACISTTIYAQRLAYIPGDILIQLEELPVSQSAKTWVTKLQDHSGIDLKLEYQELISSYVRVHLIRFDYQRQNGYELLDYLRSHPQVANAQFNHFVSNRETIPDDPEFMNQWQYINLGQDGGTVGADIDMDLAWDFATGGLTANGDTIVACIIDDGIDNDHPDIEPNLWLNHGEIPGDGVDNDSNGYVDDYRGWSTSTNDDNVYVGGGHGTPVAGIVGAKGNNGFGVAGVNWDVKLMIISGGTGVESEVLQAYSYPLEMRKSYNESGGGKGAFVVSTNASWGVDFGQPEDSPLWCAFYDSLGVQGILSCGATINDNVDVDAEGDLPTGCSSDYLISVTNMNRNDEKVTGAGYGLETIDLGAFGAETWTTASGGGFGGFGGTSGATPHVTGAIALMYSLECPDLMDLVATNPGAAATLIKDAILGGVDFNESLQDITVTGGRLNIANSIGIVLDSCGSCLPPFQTTALAETDSLAIISWETSEQIGAVDFRWRQVGEMDWIEIDSAMAPLSISDLTACTTYEYQLKAICDTLSSAFGRSRTFVTEGCCVNPDFIELSEITDSSALLSWDAVYAASGYNLQIRALDAAADWVSYNTTAISQAFDDLNSCSAYEWRFQLVCGPDSLNYTPPTAFYTLGCGPCTDLTYCNAVELSVVDEWIGSIVIGDLTNTSDAGENGYTDFTRGGPTASMTPFQLYELALSPAFANSTFNEGWAIFIDLNQDGDFDEDNEQVYQSSGLSNEEVTGNFSIPAEALRGYTRMRVVMLYEQRPTAACGNIGFGFGEVEDYCITINDPEACLAPTTLAQDPANTNNDSTIYLNWEAVAELEEYQLQYRPVGTIDWAEITVTGTNAAIAELEACTTYEIQIQTNCFTDFVSDYSPTVLLSTTCVNAVLELENLLRWELAPNPTNTISRLFYSFREVPIDLKFQMFDALGRQLIKQQLPPTLTGSASVDLSSYAPGVYYLRLVTDQGYSQVQRLIRQ